MKKLLLFFLLCQGVNAQNFFVQNSKILAPDGSEFIIRGTNVNGPSWPWPRPTLPDVGLITDTWKFNTIRVNFFPGLRTTFPNNNTNHEAIVTAFTNKKVVVQLENHDFTGEYPQGNEITQLKNFWVDLAQKYKSNP